MLYSKVSFLCQARECYSSTAARNSVSLLVSGHSFARLFGGGMESIYKTAPAPCVYRPEGLCRKIRSPKPESCKPLGPVIFHKSLYLCTSSDGQRNSGTCPGLTCRGYCGSCTDEVLCTVTATSTGLQVLFTVGPLAIENAVQTLNVQYHCYSYCC